MQSGNSVAKSAGASASERAATATTPSASTAPSASATAPPMAMIADPLRPTTNNNAFRAGVAGVSVANPILPTARVSGGGIKHQVVLNAAGTGGSYVPIAPVGGANNNQNNSNIGRMSRPNNGHGVNNGASSHLAPIQSRHHPPHPRTRLPPAVPVSTAAATNKGGVGGPPMPHLLPPDAVICATCGFPGADLRIKGCGRGCAYHVRCIDLVGMCNAAHDHKRNNGNKNNNNNGNGDSVAITVCPNCNGPANGLEIIPLSFAELDRTQGTACSPAPRKSMGGGGAGGGGTSSSSSSIGNSNASPTKAHSGEMSRKRSSKDLLGGDGGAASYPSNVNLACRAANVGGGGGGAGNPASSSTPSSSAPDPSSSATSSSSSSRCYDPAVPRTGRWTDEELAFRDAIIARFLDGSLPLSNGLKLNDFLSSMLKSKQSRLTKKMKHAKLSTKYFRIRGGRVSPASRAIELSALERDFVAVIADPVERAEIGFHMQREWRDHAAERCTYLRIRFDAEAWLRSVDAMDRRVALEKNRSRMVKRRCLMGKAMEKDVSESLPGVFIDQVEDRRTEDFLKDMEVKSRQVRTPSLGSYGGNTGNGPGGNDNEEVEDGDFGRFLMSMLDEAPIAMSHPSQTHSGGLDHRSSAHHHPPQTKKAGVVRSSYCDPNFRYAAPFLAGITSYMERNGVPFEHVDIWVPSKIPPALEGEGQGSTGSAPMIGQMGSGGSGINLAEMETEDEDGAAGAGSVCRLCFAGSATLGVQIVDEPSTTSVDASENDADGGKRKNETTRTKTIAPLSGDEIFNFSLYGDYSEKFSFSSGCGLPGRVFHSGVAAWEQFLAHAPPEMFERRGGAIQFGIRTALGLPIESPNVGRIVLVLYSKHNREKDEELVNRMVKDVKLFNPCPRWKLVVDVRSSSGNGTGTSPVTSQPPAPSQPPPVGMAGSTSFSAGMSALSMQPTAAPLGMDLTEETPAAIQHPTPIPILNSKNNQIINLISLVQENMPSDQNSPLGKQLNSIMSLRMILLRPNRSPDEEQLIETMLVLFESYTAAGRTRPDIALLVTRDFDFHTQHQQRVATLSKQIPMASMQAQQQPQQHLMQHNFNQPGPLGGRPHPAGSFLPAPLAPPQQPFVGGVPGGQVPMLQNVVHPYPLSPGHPEGGMQAMHVPMQQTMLTNTHPPVGSNPPLSKTPPNDASTN